MKYKKKILVSVIVPTLNGEIFLDECLSSIKNQTMKNYELIVSDGNSEDNTLKIAKKYADKIIVSKKRGVAYQQNNGIKLAKGNILLFVHQDMALAPNYIESALTAVKNGYIMGKGKILPKGNSFTFNIYFKIDNFLDNFFSKFNRFLGFTHFFIKKDLLLNNKFEQELYWDLNILKKIRKSGKIILLKDTYAISLDCVYENGKNIVLFRGKKVSFWRILFIRWILFGALSIIGFKFKH